VHTGRISLASVSSVLLFPLFDWLHSVCDGLEFLFWCRLPSSHLYPSISCVDVGGAKVAFAWTVIIVIDEGVKLTFYGVRREFYLHLIGFSLLDRAGNFSFFGLYPNAPYRKFCRIVISFLMLPGPAGKCSGSFLLGLILESLPLLVMSTIFCFSWIGIPYPEVDRFPEVDQV